MEFKEKAYITVYRKVKIMIGGLRPYTECDGFAPSV